MKEDFAASQTVNCALCKAAIVGRPLDARKLARMLKPYGIRPHTVRVGDTTLKGYLPEEFADAFSRYIPGIAVTSVTQDAPELDSGPKSVTGVTLVTDKISPANRASPKGKPDDGEHCTFFIPDEVSDVNGNKVKETQSDMELWTRKEEREVAPMGVLALGATAARYPNPLAGAVSILE